MKRLEINTPGRAVTAVLCVAALGYGALQFSSGGEQEQPTADTGSGTPEQTPQDELFGASWDEEATQDSASETADWDTPHEIVELREQRRRAVKKATELAERYQNLGIAVGKTKAEGPR